MFFLLVILWCFVVFVWCLPGVHILKMCRDIEVPNFFDANAIKLALFYQQRQRTQPMQNNFMAQGSAHASQPSHFNPTARSIGQVRPYSRSPPMRGRTLESRQDLRSHFGRRLQLPPRSRRGQSPPRSGESAKSRERSAPSSRERVTSLGPDSRDRMRLGFSEPIELTQQGIIE